MCCRRELLSAYTLERTSRKWDITTTISLPTVREITGRCNRLSKNDCARMQMLTDWLTAFRCQCSIWLQQIRICASFANVGLHVTERTTAEDWSDRKSSQKTISGVNLSVGAPISDAHAVQFVQIWWLWSVICKDNAYTSLFYDDLAH